MSITVSAKTSRGVARDINQDNYGYLNNIDDLNINLIAVVADGLGGLANGDIASKTAVDMFLEAYKNTNNSQPITQENLITLFSQINNYVYDSGISGESMHQNPRDPSMATTLSTVIISEKSIKICHIGDSRIYLYRNNSLSRFTIDHSWVAEAIQSGKLTEEEAHIHPMRNIVTQVIGSPRTIRPFYLESEIIDNDRIILCTDGIHGTLTDNEISEVINDNDSKDMLLNSLFAKAQLNGSTDDMTAIVIDL